MESRKGTPRRKDNRVNWVSPPRKAPTSYLPTLCLCLSAHCLWNARQPPAHRTRDMCLAPKEENKTPFQTHPSLMRCTYLELSPNLSLILQKSFCTRTANTKEEEKQSSRDIPPLARGLIGNQRQWAHCIDQPRERGEEGKAAMSCDIQPAPLSLLALPLTPVGSPQYAMQLRAQITGSVAAS